jgi:hypothetical protein
VLRGDLRRISWSPDVKNPVDACEADLTLRSVSVEIGN